MALRVVQFLALVLTALALIPAGAHLFALPNKIGLAQEQYFIAAEHLSRLGAVRRRIARFA